MTEEQREGGAWIGRQPDENTDRVRRALDEDDERVAATNTESSGVGGADERVQGRGDEWPHGHREGHPSGGAEVRPSSETE